MVFFTILPPTRSFTFLLCSVMKQPCYLKGCSRRTTYRCGSYQTLSESYYVQRNNASQLKCPRISWGTVLLGHTSYDLEWTRTSILSLSRSFFRKFLTISLHIFAWNVFSTCSCSISLSKMSKRLFGPDIWKQ